MKNFILMLSLTALVFSGCKKKEDPAPSNNNNNNTKTGVLVAKVNGKAWESNPSTKMTTFAGSPVTSTNATIEVDTLAIMGISENGPDTSAALITVILKANRVGTYTTNAEVSALFLGGTTVTDILTAAFGYTSTATFEITKFDASAKKMSGKFTITMTPSDPNDPDTPAYTVTEGTFTDLSFQ